jgi:hypothetical protein
MTIFAPELRVHFIEMAKAKGVPYLRELPPFKGYDGELSFLVVGSVAGGLCAPNSIIDVAVVGETATAEGLGKDPAWAVLFPGGRAGSARVDGVPLQFYFVTYNAIEAGLGDLRDSYFYNYGNPVIIHDPKGRYAQLHTAFVSARPHLRRLRLEGKLDMLRRRYADLETSLRYRDLMSATWIGLELITLGIKVTALIDDVHFDPRKRLFLTGLAGRLGYQLEGSFRQMVAGLAELAELRMDSNPGNFRFPVRLASVIQVLSEEARTQGFRVGLERLDPRCAEG